MNVPHCWHRMSPRIIDRTVEGWTEYRCCHCGDFHQRFWRKVPIATPDHGPFFTRHRTAWNALPIFGCEAQEPAPICLDCGASDELVRPGKWQPTCDCHKTCEIHGKNKIVYHAEGEFPRVSGYFCAECLGDSGTQGGGGG